MQNYFPPQLTFGFVSVVVNQSVGGEKKCVVALWFTEAVLKYGKSEYH